MNLSIWLEDARKLDDSVWAVDIEPTELESLKTSGKTLGDISVLSVDGEIFTTETGGLRFLLNDATVLNRGRLSTAIIVKTKSSTETEKHSVAYSLDADNQTQIDHNNLDEPFLASCVTNSLPKEKVEIISYFLSQVRRAAKDQLVEGAQRKWTTYPSNFLAIVIQTRKLQFDVSVFKTPELLKATSLDVKPSRRPYYHFHLHSKSQLDDAVNVAIASARSRLADF